MTTAPAIRECDLLASRPKLCLGLGVAKTYPRVKLHIAADSYATYKHANVKAWLVKHPRFHLHFIPTSSSWLNLVSVNRP